MAVVDKGDTQLIDFKAFFSDVQYSKTKVMSTGMQDQSSAFLHALLPHDSHESIHGASSTTPEELLRLWPLLLAFSTPARGYVIAALWIRSL